VLHIYHQFLLTSYDALGSFTCSCCVSIMLSVILLCFYCENCMNSRDRPQIENSNFFSTLCQKCFKTWSAENYAVRTKHFSNTLAMPVLHVLWSTTTQRLLAWHLWWFILDPKYLHYSFAMFCRQYIIISIVWVHSSAPLNDVLFYSCSAHYKSFS
jgi:hypothetical protein